MRLCRAVFLAFVCSGILQPTNAYADFWGGDLPLLTEIVANTLQQLTQLGNIVGTGKDTLSLLEDINRGLNDAMQIARTSNHALEPGVLSELTSAGQLLQKIETLYGKVPASASSPMQGTIDASVAESIHLHNEAFRYADEVDPEAERIKDYAHNVNPAGAAKLQAQATGVLIHVANQLLRTSAALLKVQSEALALQNRREKMDSEQNRTRYTELAASLDEFKVRYQLPPLTQ